MDLGVVNLCKKVKFHIILLLKNLMIFRTSLSDYRIVKSGSLNQKCLKDVSFAMLNLIKILHQIPYSVLVSNRKLVMQYYKPIAIAILLTSLAGFTSLQTSNNFIIIPSVNLDGVQTNNIEENANRNEEMSIIEQTLPYHQFNFLKAAFVSYLQVEEKEERSDLFYYILGILILIVSAFILRQRYKQYLEEKNKLNQ